MDKGKIMAKDCLMCHGFKFEDKHQEIPGTFTMQCKNCYLVNLVDEDDRPLGWLKRFSHENQQYVFHAFKDKNLCLLVKDMKNGNFKIIDQFPNYLDVNDVRQSTLIELVDFKNNEEKLYALPDIKV